MCGVLAREAGNLGTRICVLNNWTEQVSVTYAIKDTDTGTGPLGPGMQSCAEGTFFTGCDVNGAIISPELGAAAVFSAYNPWFAAPGAWVFWQELNDGKPDVYCRQQQQAWTVGETGAWPRGPVKVFVERLPDDQWKEFVFVIEPR
jgi:hypothetical protein